MINVFYKNRHTLYRFMVALMFVSGSVFAFTFDRFVSEPGATGCCSGGGATVTSFAADSSGGFGGDLPMDVEATDDCCGGKDAGIFASESSGCNCLGPDGPCSCGSGSACGGNGSRSCPSSNPNCSVDTAVCANYCSSWCVQGNGGAPCQGKCDQ